MSCVSLQKEKKHNAFQNHISEWVLYFVIMIHSLVGLSLPRLCLKWFVELSTIVQHWVLLQKNNKTAFHAVNGFIIFAAMFCFSTSSARLKAMNAYFLDSYWNDIGSSISETVHTKLQPFLDFRLVPEVPLIPGLYMDPKWAEFSIGMLVGADPPEIVAPVTPGVSQGTKIFGSKFFSYHSLMIIFYPFCGVVLQKLLKNENWCQF